MKINGVPIGEIAGKVPGWAWGIVAVMCSIGFFFYMNKDTVERWQGVELRVAEAEQKAVAAKQEVDIQKQQVAVLKEQVTALKDQIYQGNIERDSMRRRIAMLEERTAER